MTEKTIEVGEGEVGAAIVNGTVYARAVEGDELKIVVKEVDEEAKLWD